MLLLLSGERTGMLLSILSLPSKSHLVQNVSSGEVKGPDNPMAQSTALSSNVCGVCVCPEEAPGRLSQMNGRKGTGKRTISHSIPVQSTFLCAVASPNSSRPGLSPISLVTLSWSTQGPPSPSLASQSLAADSSLSLHPSRRPAFTFLTYAIYIRN